MSDDRPLEGELIPAGTFDIAIAAHPLHAACVQAVVMEGCSLRELGAGGAVLAFIDGERIADLDVIPRAGQSVLLKAVPQGGGDALRLIATIAVIAAAAFIVGPGALALTGAAQTTAFAGLTLVGQLAITALIPPVGLNLDRPQGLSPFRGIQRTNNRIAPYEVVPKLYGTHRLFPPYAALPVPVSRGGQQDFLGLYCVGWRNLNIDVASLKLGETPLSSFAGAEVRIWDYTKTETLEDIFPFGAVTDSTNGDLRQVPAVLTRVTEPNTKRYEIECGGGPIGFFGLKRNDSVAVGFKIEYRTQGSTGVFTVATPTYVAGDGGAVPNYPDGLSMNGRVWSSPSPANRGPLLGPAGYVQGSASDVRTYTVTVSITFPAHGQFEVRISRLNAVRFNPEGMNDHDTADTKKVRQEITLLRARSVKVNADGSVIGAPDARFAYVALKLKASDQLTGAVDDFNCVATAVVPVWNGTAFVMQASNSPAWAYRDVLLGTANGRPVTAAKIDDATLIQWAADCAAETPPREFNGAFDGLTSVFEALKNIASAGRAAFSMRDGKYSVVRDVAGKTPVQLFTPRNLWQFSAAKSYSRLPHALKIKFHDRAAGWIEAERIVYADGYSLDGSGGTTVATLFEQLSLFGCTHKDQAFKDGRYLQAVGKLRPETFSWNAAIEHLVCQRGDVVRVQHDAMLVGLGAGRIIALDANTVTLDETVLIESGKTYQVRIRRDDATTVLQTLTNAAGETRVLTLSGGVSAGVKLGDVVAFGESGLVTLDALITAIEPGADLTATIRAVPYSSPGVHTADAGTIPAYNPVVTAPQYQPPAPTILNIDSSAEIGVRNSDGTYTPRIFVSYAFNKSEALITGVDGELRPTGATNWSGGATRPNNGSLYFDVVSDEATYDLRLRGRNDRGTPGPWTEVYGYVLETARVSGEPGIALIEQTNNPATPNRDLSTVLTTVTPPSPAEPSYSHAFIDFRRPADASWTEIGPTDTSNQARQVLNSDGTTYEFRARAVNSSGVIADFGATLQITLSLATGEVPTGDPDVTGTADAALNVANLRVFGQLAAVTTFGGPDAVVQWDAVVPPAGQTLRDYRVRILDGATVLRVQYVVATKFTWDYQTNSEDSVLLGYSGPRRQMTFEVVARTSQGKRSAAAASKVISNPAPTVPAGITRTVKNNAIEYRFTVTDTDFVKAQLHLSTSSGFTPSAANLVYEGATTNPILVSNLNFALAYYAKFVLTDLFGAGAVSAEYADTTGQPAGPGEGDTVAPAAVTSPTATAGLDKVVLEWVNPTDKDLRFVRIFRGTTAGFTADAASQIAAQGGTIYIDAEVINGTAYYYKFQAEDFAGNVAAISAAVGPATPTRISAANIASYVDAAAIQAAQVGFNIGGGNVLLNSSFEVDADANGIADSWTAVVSGTGGSNDAPTYSLPTVVAVFGTKAQRAQATNFTGVSRYIDFRQVAPWPAGQKGVLTATVTATTGHNVQAFVQFFDAALALLDTATLPAYVADGNPARYELRTNAAPANTANVRVLAGRAIGTAATETLFLQIDNAQFEAGEIATSYAPKPDEILAGTIQSVHIDDAAITSAKLADDAVTAAKLAVQIGGGNIVNNSSFEADSNADNFPDGWTLSLGSISDTQGLFLSASETQHGSKALKIQAAAAAKMHTYQPWALPAGRYTFSAYVYRSAVSAGGSGINIDFISGSGTVIDRYAPGAITVATSYDLIVTDSNARRREWVTIDIPAAATGRLYCQQGFSGNSTGTTIFDAIQVEAGDVLTAYAPRPDEILAGTITATEIADNAITSPKIIAGAVVAGKIAANAVTANEIAAGSITTAKITAGAVTATEIAALAVTAGKIAANAVTATEIAANSITAIKILAGAIVAGKIAANAVQAGNVAANAITTRELIVGDFTNLCENADFELGDVGWAKSGAWAIVNDPANAFGGNWIARSLSSSVSALRNAFKVRCQPGEQFYATARIKTSAAAGGGYVRIQFEDKAGAGIATSAGNNVIGTAYALSAVTAVVVANAVTAEVEVVCLAGGDVYVDNVQLFRVSGSALIADAAIITAKINDLAVTSAKIQSLDVGKLTAGTMTAAIIQSTGHIVGGKSSYADAAAGYFLGFDASVPKLKIGSAANYLDWNGTGLTVQGVIQTAASGQRVVLTSGNETEFYDEVGSLSATIGIRLNAGNEAYVVGGLAQTGTPAVGTAAQKGRTGVRGFSGIGYGVHGFSAEGIAVFGETSSAAIAAVYGFGGAAGVFGRADTGVRAQATLDSVGGALVMQSQAAATAAPTHTASSGTHCVRQIGTVTKIYHQTAGGFGGTGSTWVLIGNAI